MKNKMINKDPEIVPEKICRSCMCQSENMRNLYEPKETNGGPIVQVADMLMDCTALVVKSGDGLPSLLCKDCEDKLCAAYEFKQQCHKTDHTLRSLINPGKVKEEYECPNEDGLNVMACLEINHYSTGTDNENEDRKDKFKCTYCAKVLATKRGLIIHQRRHTGDNMKTCKICKSKFTRTNHLLRHMKTHDGNTCGACGDSFVTRAILLEHQKQHTNSPETKIDRSESSSEDDEVIQIKVPNLGNNKMKKGRFNCKHCGKGMTTYVGLKIHMRKHTGTDLSKCNYCEKSFTKNSHLKRHLLSHGVQDDNKQIASKSVMECEFCDRKFKYRKSFTHHMQTEHGMSDESDVPLSAYVIKEQKEDTEEQQEQQQQQQDVQDLEIELEQERMEMEEATEQTEDCEIETKEIEIEGPTVTMTTTTTTTTPKEKGRKVHVCHVCQCTFGRANHLTRHMTLHRSLLTNKCDRCEKAFATAEFLRKHIEEDHVNKPYMCTTCNKPFSRGEHLIRHLKVHQSKDDKSDLKCSICEKVFARSDILARHIKIHLLQDKRHVCAECGKAFNRLDNLKTHQRIHTGVKDTGKLHLCVYCGKEFNNSSNMIVHMRRHTGERPYKCTECGKGFPRSHDLKCHERTHSGEKPYRCSICGKAFNKSNKLLRHTRVHTGERPYVCNICGRAFTQSNDLALHMRRHTGSRPYACGICPARFIQSGQLKAHRRTNGHWMETQPDLKGGYRVEPVTPVVEPAPIRFKTYTKAKEESDDGEEGDNIGEVKVTPQPTILPLSLMGAALTSGQPLLIDNAKIVELQNAGLVSLVSADGIKFKPGNTFTMPTVKTELPKSSDDKNCAFQNAVTVTYTVEAPESYSFQNFN